ncbi:lytic transglycosylase domain-containing protein [Phenylobacterium immobile]|uniref:lytic transglycosylase domain-containing protein n=1 Tax=Phenylobacterium immobile TaxID=21 RepID=UPI000A56E879|nr:lytic transglycosylase domain-containing protein [Phenylobacterium immobile]
MSIPLKTAALLLGAWLLTTPSLSYADVIQFDGDGFTWVVGGPATAPALTNAVNSEPEYTQALASAGPEAWSGYVALLASKYDISPALLEAVVWQESRWCLAATSSAGAQGLAQLMPATARQLGVDIRDPFANLEGGARYLRMQLDAFDGDVEKALAAYNAGPGRVTHAGAVPNIPETQAYVAAILARLANRVRR